MNSFERRVDIKPEWIDLEPPEDDMYIIEHLPEPFGDTPTETKAADKQAEPSDET